jgi:hemerythrin-like domain-containing protein
MDREKAEAQHPVSENVLRIEDSHRRIRGDLEVLEKRDDLGQIGSAVDDLPELFKEHFRDEEKPGGLFEEIASLRPALSPQLEILRDEHREILRALQGLQGQLREVDEMTRRGDLQGLHDDIRLSKAAFLKLIHRHERVESSLVADIYYMEDGGSG